jgi:hypothetical protein
VLSAGCLLFAMLISSLGSMMMGEKLLEEKVSRQLCERKTGVGPLLALKNHQFTKTGSGQT